MKFIRFIYKPNEIMMDLIKRNIADYGNDFLYGILDEGMKYQLKKCGIYLVCEQIIVSGISIYKNPLAVVAHGQQDAANLYYQETGQNASIMCDLEQYANKAKVMPLESVVNNL